MKIRFAVLGSVLILCGLAAQAQEAIDNKHEEALPPATVTGSGTTNYIPRWTGTSTLGNSKIYQTGGKIGIATTTPSVQLDVNGRINAATSYRVAGVDVLRLPGGADSNNIALGEGAMMESTAFSDTAVGFDALFGDSGGRNTAVGSVALSANFSGSANTAVGASALAQSGFGSENTALGEEALANNLDGNFNVAIGYQAANNVLSGNSNNIHIGSLGSLNDNGTVRIGTTGSQTSFFVAGVRGVTTANNDALPVMIDSNGQLGTVSSSRRFKEDIQDMREASAGLMQLRPVTFRYQKPFADGSKPIQYGLIAEDVAAVYPDLVTYTPDGQVEAVKYQVLDAMLLNEVKRQQDEIRTLQDRLAKMEAALASLSHAPEGKLSTAAVH